MAKNARRKGRSTRNGNAPSPYAKYKKQPFQYSQGYYAWKRSAMRGANRVEQNAAAKGVLQAAE